MNGGRGGAGFAIVLVVVVHIHDIVVVGLYAAKRDKWERKKVGSPIERGVGAGPLVAMEGFERYAASTKSSRAAQTYKKTTSGFEKGLTVVVVVVVVGLGVWKCRGSSVGHLAALCCCAVSKPTAA